MAHLDLSPNRQALLQVAEAIEPLLRDVVFVGGQVAELLKRFMTEKSPSTGKTCLTSAAASATSEEAQVIVFSQETEVLDWAKEHLTGSRDRLIQLNA